MAASVTTRGNFEQSFQGVLRRGGIAWAWRSSTRRDGAGYRDAWCVDRLSRTKKRTSIRCLPSGVKRRCGTGAVLLIFDPMIFDPIW